MDTPKTELPRKTSLGKLAAGALVAIGVALASASPALADSWKHNNGHGNKHWKKHHHSEYSHGGYYGGHSYNYRPKVVYVQPRPVYIHPQPVYVAPPVYYYQPAPVYRRPEINIVFPLDFD